MMERPEISAPPAPAQTAPGARRWWLHESGLRGAGGQTDLFAHLPGQPGQATKRHFVARIGDGAVIPKIPAGPLAIEAVTLPGATLTALPDGSLDAGLVPGIDAALLAIADSVRAKHGPRNARELQPHEVLSAAAGTALRGYAQVCWLR